MTTATPASSLRSLAQNRGIWIGAAVGVGPLRNDPSYRDVLAREFNILTPENAMKFEPLHPNRDRYNFVDADAVVAFAKANGMQVRGHTLVWHRRIPRWLTEGNFTCDELMAILREHIHAVVGHFRGQIIAWDVVNEAVADDGSQRSTFWLRGIGPDYIDLAFRWAHEADPQAPLFYNDYGGEGLGRKSDAISTLVQGLLQRGVPIHGVGLQMHIGLGSSPKPRDVAVNMNRLAALGLGYISQRWMCRSKMAPEQRKKDLPRKHASTATCSECAYLPRAVGLLCYGVLQITILGSPSLQVIQTRR